MQNKTTSPPDAQVQVFANPEFGKIRSVLIDGEPWLVGKDVAKALGYKDTVNALKSHVDTEDKRGGWQITTPSGTQTMTIINESGLYSLVLSSKLPDAKKFKRWVTSEVLPAIRKTGSYQITDANNTQPCINIEIIQQLRQTPMEQMPAVLDYLRACGYPVGTYEEIYGQPPALSALPAPEQVSPQDSVQMFVNQIVPQFQWQFYSFGILFKLYTNWVNREHICQKPLGRNKFVQTIASMADAGNIPNWYCPGRKHPVRPKRMMTGDEPLMAAYDVNIASYIGRANYTGIQRV